MCVLACKRWWIRNRWRAKASFVPIGQLQGLLSNMMIDSKHDELESISSTDLIIIIYRGPTYSFTNHTNIQLLPVKIDIR